MIRTGGMLGFISGSFGKISPACRGYSPQARTADSSSTNAISFSVASPSSLTRQTGRPVSSIAHSQNVNVADGGTAMPASHVHDTLKATMNLLARSYQIQPVCRWRPPASKPQRSPQSNHIAGESDGVSSVLQRHATDEFPFRAVIKLRLTTNLNKPRVAATFLPASITGLDCDAHRDNRKRFVVHADEKLTAFVELESVIKKPLKAEKSLELFHAFH